MRFLLLSLKQLKEIELFYGKQLEQLVSQEIVDDLDADAQERRELRTNLAAIRAEIQSRYKTSAPQ